MVSIELADTTSSSAASVTDGKTVTNATKGSDHRIRDTWVLGFLKYIRMHP
jgi:hypothetical protein